MWRRRSLHSVGGMSEPVIAAYDFAHDDRAPVAFAAAAARYGETPAIAVAVLDAVMVPGGVVHPAQAAASAAALARLRDDLGVETLEAVDVSVQHAVHRLAEERRARLVVVGSTRRGRPGRVWPGSTAERVLHGAPCPVVVVPRDWTPEPLETVTVGYLETPEGRSALAGAADMASATGARLRVISVLPGDRAAYALGAGLSPLEGAQRRTDERRRELEAALSAAVAEVAPAADAEVLIGDPGDVLLDASRTSGLLVCGSRAYGPLRGVLLGSVSRRVLDGAHCPVLVLPRGAERPWAAERLERGAATA